MTEEIYNRYKNDGFCDADIQRIWEDTLQMRKLHAARQGKQAREITSSTYERAQKRLKKDVENWMGKR